ncbi:unnamed protein product [Linum trigynum]|uniref:Uncharacterized protein n=1 Tax=Linum trigynum TaxID=586398 RepID=A0AAV2F0P0_9ROSI
MPVSTPTLKSVPSLEREVLQEILVREANLLKCYLPSTIYTRRGPDRAPRIQLHVSASLNARYGPTVGRLHVATPGLPAPGACRTT